MATHPDRIALITGTSSGIGLALAEELLQRNWRVVGVSRRPGKIESARYSHVSLDLGDTSALIDAMDAHLGPLVSDPAMRRVALVNNAALVALLGPVDQLDPGALIEVYAANVAAPVSLMGWFLRRSHSGSVIRIVNVSSGAAVQPFPGLGAYGSSKAALRMAGMTLATELDASQKDGHPTRDVSIMSFEPGLVDTEMQASARGSSPDVLPSIGFFKQAAADGLLVPAALPAAVIADYLDGNGFPRFVERRFEPAARGDAAG